MYTSKCLTFFIDELITEPNKHHWRTDHRVRKNVARMPSLNQDSDVTVKQKTNCTRQQKRAHQIDTEYKLNKQLTKGKTNTKQQFKSICSYQFKDKFNKLVDHVFQDLNVDQSLKGFRVIASKSVQRYHVLVQHQHISIDRIQNCYN